MESKENKTSLGYEVVNGVRNYGRRVEKISSRDLEKLSVTSEGLLHVIRHLRSLSPKVRSELESLEINDEGTVLTVDSNFIDRQLQSTGSKFNEKIQDPKLVINLAIEIVRRSLLGGSIYWRESSKGFPIATVFHKVEGDLKEALGLTPKEKLGTSSVVTISDVNRHLVSREMRGTGELKDRIEINVIRETTLPETDDLIVVLSRPENSTPYIYSAYTGIMAPSLPRPEMSPEEYEYTKQWWDAHAFIK